MTEKAELAKLFHFDKKTPRIVAYARDGMVAKDDAGTAIAVVGTLLDPETKEATKRQIFLQLQPRDAVGVALAILAIAKERNWPMPDGILVEWPAGKNQKH